MDKVKVKHNSKKNIYFDNLEIKECAFGSVAVILFVVVLFFFLFLIKGLLFIECS